MYYEARTHEVLPVNNAEHAAQLINKGTVHSYQVLQWTSNGRQFFCVPDGHIDNPFLEVAILRQEPNGSYTQIESITAGWIKTTEALAIYLAKAEKSDLNMGTAQLILGQPKGHEIARFTCSCCGNSFKGNVQEQLEHDQDAGYGLCTECNEW